VELLTNPFSARPGERPARLAGRAAPLAALDEMVLRTSSGQPTAALAVTGLAGMGTSALLAEVVDRWSTLRWWSAVVRPDGGSLRLLLADGLVAALDAMERRGSGEARLPRLRELVSTFREGSAGLVLDAIDCFRELGDVLRAQSSGIAVIVDDAHRLGDATSILATVAATSAERAIPATILLGGLPMRLGGVHCIELGPLGGAQVEELLSATTEPHGVEFHPRAAARVAQLSRGVPFLVQTFAHHAWNRAERSPILPDDVDAGAAEARADMISIWYAERVAGLDAAARRYLTAVAELGASSVDPTEVARRLGDRTRLGGEGSVLDATRDELLARGLLHRRDGRSLSFSLPAFDRFVLTQW